MSVEERDPAEGEAVSGAEAPETPATADAEPTERVDDVAAVEEESETVEEDPLVRVERERDEYLDLAQRTKADFDNYRRRVAGETAGAVARGRVESTKIGASCNATFHGGPSTREKNSSTTRMVMTPVLQVNSNVARK